MTPGCSGCGTAIPVEAILERRLVRCARCGAMVTAEVFPAFLRPLERGVAGESLQEEGEASCFYHAQKRAVRPCGSCGRFLCALCDLEVGSDHICPACLDSGVRSGRMQQVESQRTLHDRIALAVAALPIFTLYFTILTAPLAIFLALRNWRKPGSLVTPSRWRFVVAILLGVAQIVGWVALLGFVISRLGTVS